MQYHDYMIAKELHEWILKNIPKGSTILELGSGDGTDLLSKDYKMFSIENNTNWIGKFNSNYIKAPLVNGWFDVSVLKNEVPKEYDLILVDAPPAFTENARMGFLTNVELFNTKVPIIIDDTHRAGEKRLANELAKYLSKQYREIECGRKSFCVFE